MFNYRHAGAVFLWMAIFTGIAGAVVAVFTFGPETFTAGFATGWFSGLWFGWKINEYLEND